MKRFALWVLFFLVFANAGAQSVTLRIEADNPQATHMLDSLSYRQRHPDLKSIRTEAGALADKLLRAGYLESQWEGPAKSNDTLFLYTVILGQRTGVLHINYPDNLAFLQQNHPELRGSQAFLISEVQQRLEAITALLESEGYALARIQLVNFRKKNNQLLADLTVDLGLKRQVNDIVVKGYEKFPEGHLAGLRRLYRRKTFTQQNLRKINADFAQFRFVRQTRYPEILFTKDTTKVYVYLEKAAPNKFEGFVGFSNDEQSNVKLNGYLDLQLVNILNSGEAFSIYWKSDVGDQKTFNLEFELPYIFKSNLGLKAALNIFKQDSTFQTTRTAIGLGYLFNYNTRTYLGYQSSESSDIQNTNSALLNDFENSFLTSETTFINFRTDDFLFPEKTKLSLKLGLGNRDAKSGNDQQYFVNADLMHHFYLDGKNSLSFRSQDYYLQSGQYIINELYRFGGINSIRGFNENSLQGDLFTSILAEYRYRVAPNLYVHTITDFGYFKDSATKNSGNLLGLGLGMGLLTKNGLLHLVYANGSANRQEIKLSNSIVHISFKTNF